MIDSPSEICDIFSGDQLALANVGIIGYDSDINEKALALADKFELDFILLLDRLSTNK